MMTYQNIALVTGASSGIGQATAASLAKKGYNLILMARRLDRLQELAKTLTTQYNIHCFYKTCDISKRKEVQTFFDELPQEWCAIDVLINNAGLALGLTDFQQHDLNDTDTVIDTNVKGLTYVTRLVLPFMIERNSGYIINIGSVAGHGVYKGGVIYCASKHAVDAISQGLRYDLLGTNIRVTQISPGMVETEFSLVRFKGDDERAKRIYQDMQPLTPEDIADLIVHCIDLPAHVNVNEIIVMPLMQAGISAIHKNPRSQ